MGSRDKAQGSCASNPNAILNPNLVSGESSCSTVPSSFILHPASCIHQIIIPLSYRVLGIPSWALGRWPTAQWPVVGEGQRRFAESLVARRFAIMENLRPAFDPAAGRSSNQRQAPVSSLQWYHPLGCHSRLSSPRFRTRKSKKLLCGSLLPDSETTSITAHGRGHSSCFTISAAGPVVLQWYSCRQICPRLACVLFWLVGMHQRRLDVCMKP